MTRSSLIEYYVVGASTPNDIHAQSVYPECATIAHKYVITPSTLATVQTLNLQLGTWYLLPMRYLWYSNQTNQQVRAPSTELLEA